MKKIDFNPYAAILVILSYLTIAFFIVRDYGITWDEPANFGIGEKYLYFYCTGHLDINDDNPKIQNHPDFYTEEMRYMGGAHLGSFANILSAVSCYIFYQKLHLLDPISAHHIIIPILLAFFLFIFFSFVKKNWGAHIGLISLLALITYPRFFGHSFNNIKDVPETILFSVTIMLFAEWNLSHKLKCLYLAFIAFGLALATKMDALIIPIILAIWQLSFLYKYIETNASISIKTLLHLMMGVVAMFIVVLISYPPLLPWQHDKLNFLFNMFSHITNIGVVSNITWNLYAPIQIFYLTPAVMLVLFIFGFIMLVTKHGNNKLITLLIIWVLVPVLRQCLPNMNNYDGIRHFLVFVVPFAVIISIGVDFLSGMCSKLLKLKKELVILFISALFLIPNFYSLIELHPYQTTYFNSLLGGLKGAQKKEFPYSSDYWLNSYRKAGEWLNKNAKTNSNYYAYTYYDGHYILEYYISRKDLMSLSRQKFLLGIPPNTYIVIIPRKWWRSMIYESIDEILYKVNKLEIVYQIKRQKGKILTIYYNP